MHQKRKSQAAIVSLETPNNQNIYYHYNSKLAEPFSSPDERIEAWECSNRFDFGMISCFLIFLRKKMDSVLIQCEEFPPLPRPLLTMKHKTPSTIEIKNEKIVNNLRKIHKIKKFKSNVEIQASKGWNPCSNLKIKCGWID